MAIPEIAKDVYKFNDWVRKNNELLPDSPVFDPHIALCYIKNPGQFPSELFRKLREKLTGEKMELDSVNFYQGDNKTGSISL